MKLIMYEENSEIYVGVKDKDKVIKTTLTAETVLSNGLTALPQITDLVKEATSAQIVDETTLKITPVVPNPSKIICIGLNYRRHAVESGMDIPEFPVLFGKYANSIAAPQQNIPMSKEWTQVDYESELGVVIGKQAKKVAVEDALDHVLGYCNCNDLSERKLQMISGQWMLGKFLDGFMPVGPYLVTADEIPDPQTLRIRGWLNGELRQDSNTADMIFSVAESIAYISQYITLEPGDLISTGTPEGVILGYPPQERVWMQPGDEYTVEIEGLGRLTNRMVEASQ